MAQARKDSKGRALRKGETQRKYDLMYICDELVRAYKDIIRIVKLGGIKQQ